MKKSISFLLFIGILLSLCACSERSKDWSCTELNKLSQNFSIALYCSELVIVANPPEYFETVEKEGSSYKLYTVTPNEIIRGMDKATEILLEAPVDENGNTVLDALNVDAKYLLLGYRSGKNYLVFSPFCVNELSLDGKLIWDNPETKVIEDNYPFDDLESIEYHLDELLGAMADDVTPDLISRLDAEFTKAEADGEYKYVRSRNWTISSYDIWDNSLGVQKYDSPYFGTKKLLHYFADISHYIDEKDIKDFGSKGLLININTHSFESYDSSFIYDFKTDTIIRW